MHRETDDEPAGRERRTTRAESDAEGWRIDNPTVFLYLPRFQRRQNRCSELVLEFVSEENESRAGDVWQQNGARFNRNYMAEFTPENPQPTPDESITVSSVTSTELHTTREHFTNWLIKELRSIQERTAHQLPSQEFAGFTETHYYTGALSVRVIQSAIEILSDNQEAARIDLTEIAPERLKITLSPTPRPYRRLVYALLLQHISWTFKEAGDLTARALPSDWMARLWPERHHLLEWAAHPQENNADDSDDQFEALTPNLIIPPDQAFKAKRVHFRTVLLRSARADVDLALSSLPPPVALLREWEGHLVMPDLRVSWMQEGITHCPRWELSILKDPSFRRNYSIGRIDTLDMPDGKWAITMSSRIPEDIREDLPEIEKTRQQARLEVFNQFAKPVQTALLDCAPDFIKEGLTRFDSIKPALILDQEFGVDQHPRFVASCKGTLDQLRIILQDFAVEWSGVAQTFRMTQQQDGSYAIWSKPHGRHHYDQREFAGADFSHRKCGELRLIELPSGKVQLSIKSIQSASSFDWLHNWQAALPFVLLLAQHLMYRDCLEPDHTWSTLQKWVRLEGEFETLPQISLEDAPALFQASIQQEFEPLPSLPIQVFGVRYSIRVDAPTLFRHICDFLHSKRNSAFVQPIADGVSYHIQFTKFEKSEPEPGLCRASLRCFYLPFRNKEQKPPSWKGQDSWLDEWVKIEVSRIDDSRCLVDNTGWTQAGRHILDDLQKYLVRMYPPEQYADAPQKNGRVTQPPTSTQPAPVNLPTELQGVEPTSLVTDRQGATAVKTKQATRAKMTPQTKKMLTDVERYVNEDKSIEWIANRLKRSKRQVNRYIKLLSELNESEHD